MSMLKAQHVREEPAPPILLQDIYFVLFAALLPASTPSASHPLRP